MASPLLRRVKALLAVAFTATAPKSVLSALLGVLSPVVIVTPLPCNAKAGWAAQATPLAVLPGATQLELAPLRAKFVSVPL